MLKYALFPNHLTDDPNDQMAIPQEVRSRTLEEIIHRMIGRGSTVTMAEALGVLEEYEAAVEDILKEGEAINTPLFKISPSIIGVFTDENDGFDATRHLVSLNLTPGARIADIARGIKTQKVSGASPEPVLQSFKDVASGTMGEVLTPGGVGELRGSLLKVDPADKTQGIFFVGQDGTETRVTALVRNMPANLIFMIPNELTAGSYAVEVRTILKNYKSMRTGRLSASVSVL